MAVNRQYLEKNFFRALNSVVEPAVRMGFGSPRFAPGALIVLETTGFKTGIARRTPLVATRLGRYVLVSTARGERSFWVRNLEQQPDTRYYLGGRARDAQSFLMAPGIPYHRPEWLPGPIREITDRLAFLNKKGWAFAVLAPHNTRQVR